MAQWVLKANGNVVPHRTTRPLNASKLNSDTEKEKHALFNELLKKRWGTSVNPPIKLPPDDSFKAYEDDDEVPRLIPEMDDPVDSIGQVINQQPAYDKLIQSEIILPQGGKLKMARFIGRTVGPDGCTTGKFNESSIFNSGIYDVEFPDGEIKEYSANVLSKVDDEGFKITLLDSILDYRKDDSAFDKDDQYATTKKGGRRVRNPTCRWKLIVQWKDEIEQQIPLKDMKESHPVECVEFAKAHGIADEPAFIWWYRIPCANVCS